MAPPASADGLLSPAHFWCTDRGSPEAVLLGSSSASGVPSLSELPSPGARGLHMHTLLLCSSERQPRSTKFDFGDPQPLSTLCFFTDSQMCSRHSWRGFRLLG